MLYNGIQTCFYIHRPNNIHTNTRTYAGNLKFHRNKYYTETHNEIDTISKDAKKNTETDIEL